MLLFIDKDCNALYKIGVKTPMAMYKQMKTEFDVKLNSRYDYYDF